MKNVREAVREQCGKIAAAERADARFHCGDSRQKSGLLPATDSCTLFPRHRLTGLVTTKGSFNNVLQAKTKLA